MCSEFSLVLSRGVFMKHQPSFIEVTNKRLEWRPKDVCFYTGKCRAEFTWAKLASLNSRLCTQETIHKNPVAPPQGRSQNYMDLSILSLQPLITVHTITRLEILPVICLFRAWVQRIIKCTWAEMQNYDTICEDCPWLQGTVACSLSPCCTEVMLEVQHRPDIANTKKHDILL